MKEAQAKTRKMPRKMHIFLIQRKKNNQKGKHDENRNQQ